MTKSLPDVQRGQLPIKFYVEVTEQAFSPPTLERQILINDWRDGIDLSDVEFRDSFITPEEAELIKERRLEKMRQILEGHGYKVTAECCHGDDCLVHPGGVGCDG